MSWIGRALTLLAVGLLVLCTPAAALASELSALAGVFAGPEPVSFSAQQQQLPERERLIVGVTGLVLIGAVLVSRKMRKKPVFWIEWKKKN